MVFAPLVVVPPIVSWKFHLSGEFLFKSCICDIITKDSEDKGR